MASELEKLNLPDIRNHERGHIYFKAVQLQDCARKPNAVIKGTVAKRD